jgi:hypothetical protein
MNFTYESVLPCPFCASEPKLIIGTDQVRIACSSRNCPGCAATHYRLVDQAVNDWNTRYVDGHVVTFHWEKLGVIGESGVWVVCDSGYMYGPCRYWQDVESQIRLDWQAEHHLVG